MRYHALQAVTLLGVCLFALTELLTAFDSIRRVPLAVGWSVVGVGAVFVLWTRFPRPRLPLIRPDSLITLSVLACVGILTLTAIAALFSPPNSADAMAYHLPRVIYWIEQGSVRFFPTPYLNQIMLQPFAEYAMLHIHLLTSGDQWINLVQWTASLISILAVSLASAQLGFSPGAQAFAALFCASLPAGILASSGAKNDYVLAMWSIVALCFALRQNSRTDILLAGIAAGLACLTKATAFLLLPPLLATALILRRPGPALRPTATILACVLAINTPHFARNYALSGSVLGFDSAQADGIYRWRNETFGWKQTLSNAVRHTSEQVGARSESWNQAVYQAALSIHDTFRINPNDPATTWPYARFAPPRNANHEADAPNRWHLTLLLAVLVVAAAQRRLNLLLYVAALLGGFIAFCGYLKWQPFMARLLLPWFVCAAPLTGLLVQFSYRRFATLVQIALSILLLDNARLPLLENWVRPLRGPNNVFATPRNDQYFADLTPWNNRQSYYEAAVLLGRSSCNTVGIDSTNLSLEYPLIILSRQRQPGVQFVHSGVTNPSERYPQPVANPPCAVACLDCADDPKRLRLYTRFPRSTAIGRFVIFTSGQ